MIIGFIKEQIEEENRVALTPQIAELLINQGFEIIMEQNAGKNAGFEDDSYLKKSVKIKPTANEVLSTGNIILKIWAPSKDEQLQLKNNQLIVADFSRCPNLNFHFNIIALEKIPRLSRAQNMDILSSQDNLSGYKAALLAGNITNHCIPMMITSAGTIPPLKVFIWGLGVAGLQAAATLKRLGAKVFASDIREETSSQAQSVGAEFIHPDSLTNYFPKFDIIICAAGRFPKSPTLINKKTYKNISSKTVILDISGNVDKEINSKNLFREYNIVSTIAHSASLLFAQNLYNLIQLIYNPYTQRLSINLQDELIKAIYKEHS